MNDAQRAGYDLSKAIYYANSVAYQRMKQENSNINACNEVLKYANSAAGPLRILIAGEFKTGKSTLINALLGKELLKSDILPATAVITQICYGDQEKITILYKNGTYADYRIDYLKDISSETNKSFNDIRKDIERIYVFQKIEFLRYINIIDSPGINVTIDFHNETARRVYDDVDFAIWVMSITQPAKRTEVESIRNLPKYIKTLVVFNRIDDVDEEEESVDDVLRIASAKVKDISVATAGVSAFQALEAEKNNDMKLYEESRWPQLIKAIETYITSKASEHKLNALLYHINNSIDNDVLKDLKANQEKLKILLDTIKYDKAGRLASIMDYKEQRATYDLYVRESWRYIFEECADAQLLSEINRVLSIGYGLQYIRMEGLMIEAFGKEDLNALKTMIMMYNSTYTQAMNLYNGYAYSHSVTKSELLRYMNSIIPVNSVNYKEYVRFSKTLNTIEEEVLKKNESMINRWKKDREDYERLNYKICISEMGKRIIEATEKDDK